MIHRAALLARLAIAFCLAINASALAQTGPRAFPPDATFGRMTHLQESVMDLDGTAVRMAPGTVILGTDGLSIVPSVVPARAAVRYRVDFSGQINRVWVLTEEETKEARNPKANVRPR